MFRRFAIRDLTRVFPRKDFERGRRYFEEGRVRHLHVAEQPGGVLAVRGEVEGASGRLYEQEVDLEWADDELDVFSSCSCPIGFDCKHVVAVCLMVRRHLGGGAAAEDPQALDARLRRWLERVAGAGTVPRDERLIYVLLPREERAAGIGLELRVVRPRKHGGFGKGRLVRLDRVLDAVERPEFVRGEDDEVVRLIGALCPEVWDLRPDFRGRLGYLALERMLATGRCTYQHAENEPLVWGEPRPLELAWRETEDGRLCLDVSAGAGIQVLATDPPLYL
ncbi:MAG TPA: SWIM zinc finger family protein, partial [Pseudomonadales bacterium]